MKSISGVRAFCKAGMHGAHQLLAAPLPPAAAARRRRCLVGRQTKKIVQRIHRRLRGMVSCVHVSSVVRVCKAAAGASSAARLSRSYSGYTDACAYDVFVYIVCDNVFIGSTCSWQHTHIFMAQTGGPGRQRACSQRQWPMRLSDVAAQAGCTRPLFRERGRWQ